MSHEISIRSNGFAEMAFVGETPWHGLGQNLTAGASIEEWQAAAGMDWKVCRSRVRYGADDAPRIMESKHVLFRSDTKDALAVVGEDYKIVQPKQILEFFEEFAESQHFQLETAGVLFGGRQFWALAKTGPEAVVIGRDTVKPYVLLHTSCDGTKATTARFTTVRVVCNNTVQMAMKEKEKQIVKISHATAFNPDIVKARLGIAHDEFAKFMNAARYLAKVELKNDAPSEFVASLLVSAGVSNRKGDQFEAAKNSPAFKRILGLFDGYGKGSNLPGSEGTAWGMVNAVTEYVDHHARAAAQSNRLENAWFGVGDELKTAALEMALEL